MKKKEKEKLKIYENTKIQKDVNKKIQKFKKFLTIILYNVIRDLFLTDRILVVPSDPPNCKKKKKNGETIEKK